ncbi:MAG TPA: hypothetical protein VGG98_06500 [Solirubrobacteraceae bacterium]|jgi:hypothetical protein
MTECAQSTKSSPGFRPYLPDCRAYELVTPPFKFGQPPVTDNSSVAPEGSGIALSSLGAFGQPGNDATAEGGEYVETRGASAWETIAVNPSASEFAGGEADESGSSHETLDYNASLTESLFLLPRVDAKPVDSSFYLRNASNGALAEVGPLISPETVAAWTPRVAETGEPVSERYAGASADLSHVFFDLISVQSSEILHYLWPGDETIQKGPVDSLYEYTGTGNAEPELVDVSNSTTLAAAAAAEHKAHINESAKQISQCGTALGGVSQYSEPRAQETYNAIAASGETVFFTALAGGCREALSIPVQVGKGPAVAEIYARVDRARSIPISEPSRADCSECDLSQVEQLNFNGQEFEGDAEEKAAHAEEAAVLQPTFQGASQDGVHVFFISQQRLFAGAKGESGTNLYEYDFSGPAGHKVDLVATELASSAKRGGEPLPGGVVRVAEDGSRVYLVTNQAISGSRPNEFGAVAVSGADNLYVYDEASRRATFIAELSPEDHFDWLGEDSRPVEATPDGRFLLFSSLAHITPDAAGEARQLYRYSVEPNASEAGAPKLRRVSAGASGIYECPATGLPESGFNCDGNSGFPPSSEAFSPEYTRQSESHYVSQDDAKAGGVAISADGSKVFFGSPVALAPGALDNACAYESFGECVKGEQNVYEWENGQVHLLSDGRDAHPLFAGSATRLIGADPSGTDVFFTTEDALVPQDTDTQIDVYDARAEGGFPAPPPVGGCEGEACRGSAGPGPSLEAPGSAALFGAGNLIATQPSLPAVKTKVRTASQVRAERLAKALKACQKRAKRMRAVCRAHARKRYGAPHVTKGAGAAEKTSDNRRTKR